MCVNIKLNNGFTIKSIYIDDVDEVLELCLKNNDFYMLHDGIVPTMEEAEDIFTSLPPNNTHDDKYVLGIFNTSNKLAGLVEIVRNYPVDGEWIIGMMFIEPRERSCGLGKIVHNAVKEWARSNGANLLRLVVIADNEKGIKFWTSVGYKKIKEKTLEYKEKTHLTYIMTNDIK